MLPVTKMHEEDEVEFVVEEEPELATYSYISNGLCFEYFVGYEVSALLGYKKPQDIVTKNVSAVNRLRFRDYPGCKEPKLDPRTILITRDGAIEILLKCRKRVNPSTLKLLEQFGISLTNKKCLTKEQQTLNAISNAFKTETLEDQYRVGKYYLDLYLPEYKLVVECDENGHQDRKPYDERERMDYVNKSLLITDDSWIRYNPDAKDFEITKIIGQIYRRIDARKQSSRPLIKVLNEAERQAILDSSHASRAKRNIDLLPEKPCTYCHVVKPLKEFHNAQDHRDGKENICKACKKKKDSDRVQKFRETVPLPSEKPCNICSETKPLEDFYRDKNAPDGRMRRCKACHKAKQSVPITQVTITEKTCTACKVTKPVSEFYKAARSRDGYRIYCAECSRQKVKDTYAKNKEQYLETKHRKRQSAS